MGRSGGGGRKRARRGDDEVNSDASSASRQGAAAKRASSNKWEIPAAKKQKGDIKCGRCGAKSSAVEFHKVAGAGGAIMCSTACQRCYRPFKSLWSKLYSWPDVCGKRTSNKDFNTEYEKACGIMEDADEGNEETTMGSETRVGYRLKHNLVFVEAKHFGEALGSTANPSTIGVAMQKFDQPFGEQRKGCVLQHPSLPATELEIFAEVTFSKKDTTTKVSSGFGTQHVTQVFKQERKAFVNALPKALRNFHKAPTLEELQAKAKTMGQAAGEEASDEDDEGPEEEEKEGRGEEDDEDLDDNYHGDENDGGKDSAPQGMTGGVQEVADGVDGGGLASPRPTGSASASGAASTSPPRSALKRKTSGLNKMIPVGGGTRTPPGKDDDGDDDKSVISRRSRVPGSPCARSRGGGTDIGEGSGSKFQKGMVDEMARARDFEARINISDLLDGKSLGDHLYVARRFSPSVPGAQLKMSKLLKRAGIAEQLAAPRLRELSEEKRISLATALGATTECSLEYSRRLIENMVKMTTDFETLGPSLAPWSTIGDASVQPFNMLSPKVSSIGCIQHAKVEVFETILIETMFAGLVQKGQEGLEEVKGFVAMLKEIVADGEALNPLPDAFALCLKRLKTLVATLEILHNPSPTAVSECEVDLKWVHRMVMGTDLPEPWTLLSDLLEANEYWANLKKEFRRGVSSDMVTGREMADALQSLPGCNIDGLAKIMEKVPSWGNRCRRGGTLEVEHAVLARAGALLNEIEAEADTASRATQVALFDKNLSTASLMAFKQTPELKRKMAELKKKARKLSEDTSRSASESDLLSAMDTFQTKPSVENLDLVKKKVELCEGVRFAREDLVKTLRSGVSMAMVALGDPSQAAWEGQREDMAEPASRAQAVDDVKLFSKIVGVIAEPIDSDEESKVALKYLEYGYTVLSAAATLQALQADGATEPEELKGQFDKMRAGLDAISSCAYLGAAAMENKENPRLHKVLDDNKVKFAGPLEQAEKAMMAFAMECVNEAKVQLDDAVAKLTPIAGGMDNGTGDMWKKDCIGSDWENTLATAMDTLFKGQRGIARKCLLARAEVADCLTTVKKVAEGFGLAHLSKQYQESCEDVLKKVSTVIVEAKLLQILKDSKMPAATQRTNIEAVLDTMVEYQLVSTDIEASIYDQAQSVLKS